MSPQITKLRLIAIPAALAWLSAVLVGFVTLHAYEAMPGPAGRSPEGWPAGSRLAPSRGRADVLADRGPARTDCRTYGCPLVSGPRLTRALDQFFSALGDLAPAHPPRRDDAIHLAREPLVCR